MKMRIYTAAAAVLLLLTACHKQPADQTDCYSDGTYISFEYQTLNPSSDESLQYRLTPSCLFEEIPTHVGIQMQYQLKEEAAHQQVVDLLQQFPVDLFLSPEGRIGEPTQAGGYYIVYHRDGESKGWWIDVRKTAVPAELHAFMDAVQAELDFLDL